MYTLIENYKFIRCDNETSDNIYNNIMIATTCVALFVSCGHEVKDLTKDDIDYIPVS